jgi:hypothetical protein
MTNEEVIKTADEICDHQRSESDSYVEFIETLKKGREMLETLRLRI